MSDLRKAAQMALEALDGVLDTYGEPLDLMTINGGTYEALYCRDAITALRAALAQPEPPPHPIYLASDGRFYEIPQRQKPLTEEALMALLPGAVRLPPGWKDFACAIEKAHGIGVEP